MESKSESTPERDTATTGPGVASTYASKSDEYYGHVRTDVIGMIDFEPSSLLELGCGAGGTARAIKDRFDRCHLTGVELPGPAADRAETTMDRVLKADINQLELSTFASDAFDLIICADVLEHLIDPWATLRMVHRWIRPDGKLIVSLPHMGHLTVILKLLADRLEYEEEGILDRTHLKFFTLHTIRQMLESTGFHVEMVETNRSRTLKFRMLDFLTKPIGSRLSVFQYRVVATPKE